MPLNFRYFSFVKNTENFFTRIRKDFGLKLLILMSSIFFLEEGVILSLVNLNQLPFYKNVLRVNETKYQLFSLFAASPWSMKAIDAIISDLFPLFGFHKTSYMAITGFLSSLALCLLAFLRIDAHNILIAPSLVFVVTLNLSLVGLLSEGYYSKIIFEQNITHADLITWVWLCHIVGKLVGGCLIGSIVTYTHPRNVYFLSFLLSFPSLFLLLSGYMGESYVRNWRHSFLVGKLRRQIKLFSLAFLVFCFSLGLLVVNFSGSQAAVLVYSTATSAIVLVAGKFLLPGPIYRCNVFIFLQEAFYLRIMGALDYFYTSDSVCVPNGPNFGMNFYLTFTQLVGCLSGIFGVFLFQRYTRKWTFRKAFLCAIIARITGSIFDMIIISRFNRKLGVSDHVAFIFGHSMIVDVAYSLVKMPAVLLTTRLVEKNVETTLYAILASFHDFGKNVSISMGTLAMSFFGIDFDVRPCEYSKLPLLVFVSHAVLPLLSIPLLFWLIPNIRMDDLSAFERYKSTEKKLIDGEIKESEGIDDYFLIGEDD